MALNNNVNTKKRKHGTQLLSVKLHALHELKIGTPMIEVANKLKVTPRTVKNWVKNENKLMQWEEQHNDEVIERKRMRYTDNSLVDKATWLWFTEQRAAGVPIQGTTIQLQAKFFHTIFGGSKKFEASNGWLHKWQKRYNICGLSISNEKLSADTVAAEMYKIHFKNYIEMEELTPDQIFNCDETRLNYKMMPKTNVLSENDLETCGVKGRNEKVTVMACSNASGTLKFPLVVIGKYARPRAIKDLRLLPVYYKNQNSAWMNSSLFEEWFETEFVPKVTEFLISEGLPNKAILFIDNCPAHPTGLSNENIFIEFFPSNTTSLIQPMEQGCLQNLKMFYRQSLMRYIIDNVNCGETLTQSLQKITIKDVIFWIALAWENITRKTIRDSWKSLLPLSNNIDNEQSYIIEQLEDPIDPLPQLLKEFCEIIQHDDNYNDKVELDDVSTWFHSSNEILLEDCLNDEEIIDIIRDTDRSNDDRPPLIKSRKVTTYEAQKSLNNIIAYLDEYIISKETLSVLHDLKEAIKTKRLLLKST
ncbi:hypothetical protein PV327_004370 [Microctonus hyperodae]|uniref:HTH CENPB-type domain-containing protein n=1 Tax=Microctonus hyperodae TaxID=165561 RepID=A0AA39KMI0_MICHY|nr:hypothetical protein PV327_004370 [Microctonus hyperodae]